MIVISMKVETRSGSYMRWHGMHYGRLTKYIDLTADMTTHSHLQRIKQGQRLERTSKSWSSTFHGDPFISRSTRPKDPFKIAELV
jgi:hypothetical protein